MNTLNSVLFASVLGALLAGTEVRANCWGEASFQLRLYQNQGNYCPTASDPTRDCSDTTYTEAGYNVIQAVAGTTVYLRKAGGQQLLGTAITDASGNATISWFDPDIQCFTSDTTAVISWRFEHGDGRFQVFSIDGNTWSAASGTHTLIRYTAQNLGTFTRGSAASPDPLANVYDGASRMWSSLNNSARMRSYFTGVAIRAFEPSPPNANIQCPTSCAFGPTNTIRLDSSAAYRPQARVMHEMGHIASQRAHPGQSYSTTADYTFDGVAGWTMTSAEYSSASFEEGFATFAGNRTIYRQSNTNPTNCNGIGVCSTAANNLYELSAGSGNCVGGTAAANFNQRAAINVLRYLQDLYDANADFAADTNQLSFAATFDSLNEFLANGTGNRGENEAYNAALTAIDDLDGHCTTDYEAAYQIQNGIDTDAIRLNNCDQPEPANDFAQKLVPKSV
jgi:hypothetical protein